MPLIDLELEYRKIMARRWSTVLWTVASGIAFSWVASSILRQHFEIDGSLAWLASFLVSWPAAWWICAGREPGYWPTDIHLRNRLLLFERDRIQQRRLRTAIVSAVAPACILLSTISLTLQGALPPGNINRGLLAVYAVGTLPFVLGIEFHRDLRALMNDELTRFLRARALVIGYCAVVVGVSATYLGGLYEIRVATLGLPVVLFLAATVPVLSFALLERRVGGRD